MKIYKIQYTINNRIERGKDRGRIERIETRDEIVVDNFDSAINLYKRFWKRWENHVSCYGYFGFVEVFEPHIYDDGTLAYFPDDENYIGRTERDDGGEIETTHKLKEEKFFDTKH